MALQRNEYTYVSYDSTKGHIRTIPIQSSIRTTISSVIQSISKPIIAENAPRNSYYHASGNFCSLCFYRFRTDDQLIAVFGSYAKNHLSAAYIFKHAGFSRGFRVGSSDTPRIIVIMDRNNRPEHSDEFVFVCHGVCLAEDHSAPVETSTFDFKCLWDRQCDPCFVETSPGMLGDLGARINIFKDVLAAKCFYGSSLGRLPVEIIDQIWNYCKEDPSISAIFAQKHRQMRHNLLTLMRKNRKVRLTGHMHLSYEQYGARHYITYIGNKCVGNVKSAVAMDIPKQMVLMKTVGDSIGLRGIHFSSSTIITIIETFPNDVYQTFRLPRDGPLELDYDNMLVPVLQRLNPSSKRPRPPFDESYEWDTINVPHILPCCKYQYNSDSTIPRQYRCATLRPGLQGLIACYNKFGPIAIFSWYGESDTSWMKENKTDTSLNWLFLQLRQEEVIVDVVVINWPQTRYGIDMTLAVRTNKGSFYHLGPYLEAPANSKSTSLNPNKNKCITAICYNAYDHRYRSISHLAVSLGPFDQGWDASANEAPSLKLNATINASSNIRLYIHHSSNILGFYEALLGILITYEDGSYDVLGQWNWDPNADTKRAGSVNDWIHTVTYENNTLITVGCDKDPRKDPLVSLHEIKSQKSFHLIGEINCQWSMYSSPWTIMLRESTT